MQPASRKQRGDLFAAIDNFEWPPLGTLIFMIRIDMQSLADCPQQVWHSLQNCPDAYPNYRNEPRRTKRLFLPVVVPADRLVQNLTSTPCVDQNVLATVILWLNCDAAGIGDLWLPSCGLLFAHS